MLISFINRLKDLGATRMANLAFAILLEDSLEYDYRYDWIWEESNEYSYCLATIKEIRTGKTVCIPAPLLKRGEAFRDSTNLRKLRFAGDHHRLPKSFLRDIDFINDELRLIKSLLLQSYPRAMELAEKHLAEFDKTLLFENTFSEKRKIVDSLTFGKDTGSEGEIIIDLGGKEPSEIDWNSVRLHPGNGIWYLTELKGCTYKTTLLPCHQTGILRVLVNVNGRPLDDISIWEFKDSQSVRVTPKPVLVSDLFCYPRDPLTGAIIDYGKREKISFRYIQSSRVKLETIGEFVYGYSPEYELWERFERT
jgi:hypothetical protein